MATRKYKSKKHLSKKHGKKSKNHKKHAKKTRKYRKKRGGDKSPLQYKYFPQYKEILETLDKIGAGNESVKTDVPGQFSDEKTQMKPTDMLKEYLKINNTVSCGRRLFIGDKQNCDKQKRRLYDNIITKIQDTRDKINKNSSLNNEDVRDINETLNNAEVHFTSKILSHV